MAVVRLEKITKRYGGTVAVEGVDLTIGDGEFMVLLGPSGCGKSTTLRMIAGLETITSGQLSIDAVPMNAVSARDRDIAMVFQSYALYPHMSVRNNLAFGLRRRAMPRDEIDRRVERVADQLELTPLLDRKPHALSGGQRQRVALGRAIVRDPKVFLFDEPLSNLDAGLRTRTRAELLRQHRRLGATMIYVTHDQVEAMTMGTRICIMNKGRVVQVGAPLDVYRNPADTFVAAFIGSPPMNLMTAEIGQSDDSLEVGVLGTRIRLPDRARFDLTALAGRAVTFGIRPESIVLAAPDRPHETDGERRYAAVRCSVLGVEHLGAETLLTLDVGNKTELVARLDGTPEVGVDDVVEVLLDPQAIHLFDPLTGKALKRASPASTRNKQA
jgi:multiple sugar transport system ATP-binding protein